MQTPRFATQLLFAGVLAFSIWACAGEPWLRVRHVPEDGFAQTLNYQFRATVRADSLGDCQQMSVQVKPLNKLYTGDQPPSRLELFDDDCRDPIRFERAQYISNETGEHVRLAGSQVTRFLSTFARLENELMGWLWRAGVI